MDPFSIGAAGVGLIGSVLTGILGSAAAAREREIGLERVRQQDTKNALTLGEAQASGAASGVEYSSGSLQTYLNLMSAEFRRQSELGKRSVNEGADAMQTAGIIGGFTNAAGTLFQFGQSNNWWRQSPLKTPGGPK